MEEIKVLFSRRNKVELITEDTGRRLVRKTFADSSCCERETFVLKRLAGEQSPRLISETKNVIETSFVDGKSLFDELFYGEREKLSDAARAVSAFLRLFSSRLPGYYLFDMNLRNFIIADDVCYGLDFEEVAEGDMKISVAKLIVFCTFYELDRERIMLFCDAFAKGSGFSMAENIELLEKEAVWLATRRGIALPYESIKAFLFEQQ